MEKAAELAERWYRGRFHPNWRPRSKAGSQALLTGLGLTGDFWRL